MKITGSIKIYFSFKPEEKQMAIKRRDELRTNGFIQSSGFIPRCDSVYDPIYKEEGDGYFSLHREDLREEICVDTSPLVTRLFNLDRKP